MRRHLRIGAVDRRLVDARLGKAGERLFVDYASTTGAVMTVKCSQLRSDIELHLREGRVDAGLVDQRELLVGNGTPFADSSPQAQRLKVGNACPPISTFSRAIPSNGPTAVFAATYVLPCTRGSYTPANWIKRQRPASQCVGSCSCPHTAKRSRATVQSDEMPEPYKRTSSCATCTRQNDTYLPYSKLLVHGKTIPRNYLRGHENTYAVSTSKAARLWSSGG